MHLSTSIALAIALMAGQNVTNVATVADVRKLYDAGRYQEVIRASDLTNGEAPNASALQYLAAQSYTKLRDTDGIAADLSASRRHRREFLGADREVRPAGVGQTTRRSPGLGR